MTDIEGLVMAELVSCNDAGRSVVESWLCFFLDSENIAWGSNGGSSPAVSFCRTKKKKKSNNNIKWVSVNWKNKDAKVEI